MSDLICALVGITLIGVGLWMHDPGYALAAVGSIVFVTSAIAAIARRSPPSA